MTTSGEVHIVTDLGISPEAKPTLRALMDRIRRCNQVTSAGQVDMQFLLEEDAALDARLDLVDREYVAIQKVPPKPRQADMCIPRRRRGIDHALLLDCESSHEQVQATTEAAATSALGLLQTGYAINSNAAEDLPAALEAIEKALEISTDPACRFLQDRQRGFEVRVDEADPVAFLAPQVRGQVATGYSVRLTIVPEPTGPTAEVRAMVVARDLVAGQCTAQVPADVFRLESSRAFRFGELTAWQQVVLAAARALSLEIEVVARHVISTGSLAARAAQVDAVVNWDALLLAVVYELGNAASKGRGDQSAA